ncbi:hypothetical protein J2X31_003267 [Flavobacterium arsenatis]|uniref:Uncharacterized protein n=1 Tax=Flavobacterium arsenatis TaxID=1484332 RepID=A0ABU1TTN2_9FLAO|nr:hypothetical protein [Flavobacterium arsenatis]MDR6969240.1 hypothetical protein [Flavobacterium arsenatis]
MNNSLFYGLVLLSFNYNCTNVNSQEFAENTIMQDSIYVEPTHFSDDLVRDDALYTTLIRVDQRQNNEYVLSVQMNLKKDAYFISPNAKRDFSGKFTIVLLDSDKIATNGAITETPLSKEELDKGEGLVNFVRKNTHYKQTLKVISDEDFEINGYLQFTIEPRCTLEKIPFILSYKNGKLSLKMDGC